MKAEIKGSDLVITLPIRAELKDSKSGKTTVIASSGGNQTTELEFHGKKVTIGVNAYIKKD